MKVLRTGVGKFFVVAGLAAWTALPAQALSTAPYTPPPVQSTAPVTVAGYGFGGTKVTYVQLFNKSDEVVDLSGWQLEYLPGGSTEYSLLVRLDGLLRPSSYVLAVETGLLEGADYTYDPPVSGTPAATKLRLLPVPQYKPEDVKLPTGQEISYWRRNISESTGNYLSTFSSFIPTEDTVLYGGGLYDFPEEAGLQVSEVLPNPRDCSPIDTSLDCLEYVKLHNPTTGPIDLSIFRLRVGYQGQSETSSNTILLGGLLEPGRYLTVTVAADGQPVTLTNSGGYVWLEDVYGLKVYDTTVAYYPDASSLGRKGYAWAYDAAGGNWKWTARPTPGDAPSVFPVTVAAEIAQEAEAAPCQPNQYRNPETNRCRLIPVPDVASLAACAPGQYRNPLTNRCRSVETAASLTPCAAGEERNPATNRCRRIAGTEPALTPCKPDQERNPDTNRCRNKTAAANPAAAPFPVEPIDQSGANFVGWWVLGGVGVVAAGYGIWEWRKELLGAGGRAVRYLPFIK